MHHFPAMSIAVDQTRLRRIVETILGGKALDRGEVLTVLEIAQLAAGVGPEDDPEEHAALQALAQQISAIAGLRTGELFAIPQIAEEAPRTEHLRLLAAQLASRAARELAYASAFLVSVADLQLTALEKTALDGFQRALGLDDRRATDLVVFVSEVVAAETAA